MCLYTHAGKDKVVHIYDETTGQLSMKLDHGDDYNTTGHSNIIHAVNWKPNDPNVRVCLCVCEFVQPQRACVCVL